MPSQIANPSLDKESLLASFHDLGVVQFGTFDLMPGVTAPIYFDLRLLTSRPATLRRVARTMQSYTAHLSFDRLAAIPMAGLPIGIALSLTINKPLIYPRLRAKDYGTGRYIEGSYNTGETVLLVDDVLTRGKSKQEALNLLGAVRLKITDVIVVIDYQLGGAETLEEKGCRVHSLFTFQEILDTLLLLERIDPVQHRSLSMWRVEASIS